MQIKLHVNIIDWLKHLGESPSEQPVERLALVDPDRLDKRIQKAKSVLTREVRLNLNGTNLDPTQIGFPKREQIHQVAKSLVMAKTLNPKAQGERLTLSIEYFFASEPKLMSLVLPQSMGQVLLNIVEPMSFVMPSGGPIQYELKSNRVKTKPSPVSQSMTKPILDWRFAAISALSFLLLGILIGRRASSRPQA